MGKRLLVSDVDGTLLEDERPSVGLETLRTVLSIYRGQVKLVYATGRTFASTWSLVTAGVLPRPDGIVASVGTELWLPPWEARDPDFEAAIEGGWQRRDVVETVERFEGLVLQPKQFQSPLKASFFAAAGFASSDIEDALCARGLEARVIYSGGRFLDVLPARAGKRNAVELVRRRWNVPPSQVLTCGDSYNDLDMLEDTRFLGVAVGNSEAGLCETCATTTFHRSLLPFAAGVLEGAEVFHFWP